MIHIIDPASFPVRQPITQLQMDYASLVAERLPDGRYRVVKCRASETPNGPIEFFELSALVTREINVMEWSRRPVPTCWVPRPNQ